MDVEPTEIFPFVTARLVELNPRFSRELLFDSLYDKTSSRVFSFHHPFWTTSTLIEPEMWAVVIRATV